jgi:hypothetical protein
MLANRLAKFVAAMGIHYGWVTGEIAKTAKPTINIRVILRFFPVASEHTHRAAPAGPTLAS